MKFKVGDTVIVKVGMFKGHTGTVVKIEGNSVYLSIAGRTSLLFRSRELEAQP